MQSKDLEILKDMPFLFWVKSPDGVYLWGNNTINEFAGENVVGKTDDELPWADNADTLREAGKSVMQTGNPVFLHEHVVDSAQGESTLSVCKFKKEFEGKECIFGISFVIKGE